MMMMVVVDNQKGKGQTGTHVDGQTDSRQQRAYTDEQGAKTREQRADSREQRAGMGQTADSTTDRFHSPVSP
jgi:hypothetical protein